MKRLVEYNLPSEGINHEIQTFIGINSEDLDNQQIAYEEWLEYTVEQSVPHKVIKWENDD